MFLIPFHKVWQRLIYLWFRRQYNIYNKEVSVSVYKPTLTSHYFQLKSLHLPFVVTAQT